MYFVVVRGFGYVYGCDWNDVADFADCVSCGDRVEWGEGVEASASTFGMTTEMCAIWFGILVVKMAEFCLITPPIGLNCFVVAGVQKDISVQDVFRGVMPFFLADALTIGFLLMFPAVVLWLPGLAK